MAEEFELPPSNTHLHTSNEDDNDSVVAIRVNRLDGGGGGG